MEQEQVQVAEKNAPAMTDDSLQHMIELAERLGPKDGVLDDSAILAVAEATGAPVDYVRLAVKLRSDSKPTNPVERIKANFVTLDADLRRYVASGAMSGVVGLSWALEAVFERSHLYGGAPAQVLAMLKVVGITVGLYNLCIARTRKTASIAGAILGGASFAIFVLFTSLFRYEVGGADWGLLIATALGLLAGWSLWKIVDRYRKPLGLKDPAQERQDLLKQLVQLQDKLRSGAQSVTFLSIDIVGSTKMKEIANPLSIEYTFNEYHQFVDGVTRRYGGRVHSTAGDGVTCAFDTPAQAFGAARNIQAGMIELNAFRNKTGIPIRIRCGIHTDSVVLPDSDDITNLNFAHVIDVAAHLQKTAPPGCIAVSDRAAAELPGGLDGVGPEKIEASGVHGRLWKPKAQTEAATQPPKPPDMPS